jgi:hypothetical protein
MKSRTMRRAIPAAALLAAGCTVPDLPNHEIDGAADVTGERPPTAETGSDGAGHDATLGDAPTADAPAGDASLGDGPTVDASHASDAQGETGAPSCDAGPSDRSNCGYCGHDCGGGDCVGGVCQPVAIAQAPDVDVVTDMATDGTTLVWIDSSPILTLKQVSTTPGATPIVLSSLYVGQRDLAMGSTLAFWPLLNGTELEVWSATLGQSGSGMSSFKIDADGGVTDFYGLVTADPLGNTLYALVTTPNGSEMVACQPGLGCGGAAAWLTMPGQYFGRQMLFDSQRLYWADWSAGAVRGCAPPSTAITDYGTGQTSADLLATDGKYLYWAERIYNGTIRRSPLATAHMETMLTQYPIPSGLVVGGGYVYYAIPLDTAADAANAGGIFRVGSPGDAPVSVVGANQAGSAFPVRLAGGAIYWADQYTKAIYKKVL